MFLCLLPALLAWDLRPGVPAALSAADSRRAGMRSSADHSGCSRGESAAVRCGGGDAVDAGRVREAVVGVNMA